ncbi:MAG: S8 family serine peptidase, partial [Planctomycetota bacterium]
MPGKGVVRAARVAAFLVVTMLPGMRPEAMAQDEAGREAKRTPVVLVGKKQVFTGAKAFPAFCRKNRNEKRSELRTRLLKDLRELARKERPKLLQSVTDEDVRSLWIVNAVVARMTAEEVEKARKNPAVGWVFAAGRIPDEGDPGEISEVLKAAKRTAFTSKGKTIPWNLRLLRVPETWEEQEITGEGSVVAMLDMGVNYSHTDLRNNIWINTGEEPNNGKDDDGNGVADDLYGYDFSTMTAEVKPTNQHHGTFTSCVVAGDGTGGTITGVAPRARLMLLRAVGGFYPVARAYEYALENGADVMSMSFSRPGLGQARGLWRLMSEHAVAAGLVLVSGAGNFPNVKVPVQIRIPEGIPCV